MTQNEELIKTDSVRVRVMKLGPGEVTPMHYHSEVTDNIFCLKGEIVVRCKHEIREIILTPGGRIEIPVDVRHEVKNASQEGEAEYLLIQGVGAYDFLKDQT